MTLREVFAINRYCRAEKRALDRATKVVSGHATHTARVQALEGDAVLQARRKVTARYWSLLPATVKAAIKNPLEAVNG